MALAHRSPERGAGDDVGVERLLALEARLRQCRLGVESVEGGPGPPFVALLGDPEVLLRLGHAARGDLERLGGRAVAEGGDMRFELNGSSGPPARRRAATGAAGHAIEEHVHRHSHALRWKLLLAAAEPV